MSQRVRFDSQSGRIPQLWAPSLMGVGTRRRRPIDDSLSSWMFLSPFLSLKSAKVYI